LQKGIIVDKQEAIDKAWKRFEEANSNMEAAKKRRDPESEIMWRDHAHDALLDIKAIENNP
jgi:hypothetical protein